MTDQQNSYVNQLLERISLRISEEEFQLAAVFARQFWSRTPEEDLTSRHVEDDAGATIDMWRRFRERQPTEVQIKVMNPVHARDGWQSNHTVVQVMTPDMPFAVDSVLMVLSHDGLITHHLSNVVFTVIRNPTGAVASLGEEGETARRELVIYAEIDRIPDADLSDIREQLEHTTADLVAVVSDFPTMKAQLQQLADQLRAEPPRSVPADEAAEGLAFLDWLGANNFTFLGYREFEYSDDLIRQTGPSLGTLRRRNKSSERRLSEQAESTRGFLLAPRLLSFSKSGTISRVHRPAYPDYVGIKRFDDQGRVIGERGFLGLYTSRVYMQNPGNIPMVRRKVASVIARSRLEPAGFDGKVLAQVLATYPRDDLFEISEDELFQTAMAITYIHERRRLRVFTRVEPYGLFVNCLVYMPRDLFNTQSRLRVQDYLMQAFGAVDSEFDVFISESILVRLQFTLRISPGAIPRADDRLLEQKIAELTGDWASELNTALTASFGETRGRQLWREYTSAFPAGYREHVSVRIAVDDVACVEQLSPEQPLLTRFHRLPEDAEELLHLKVFRLGEPLPLSDVIPEIENMGLRVLGEHSSLVTRSTGPLVTIQEFRLVLSDALDLTEIGDRFEEAFVRIWNGSGEDDGFNRLILGAGLTWRQVGVLRAYARYMKQIRFGFSQEFISDTLYKHKRVAADLVRYFEWRFDPQTASDSEASLVEAITLQLDDIQLLNEDRILRRLLACMRATQRTNYFIRDAAGEPKEYLSIKLAPQQIDDMPRPRPLHEIFVCAPYFEGVHLRGGAIARGGLRWSDRLEDYRTEVLGLVKAQVVKNAVIVPTGAKGGFVLKSNRRTGQMPDVVMCYRDFIRGLLDLTDNIQGGTVQAPAGVHRYDGDDPYLVVAADKGTATFSDEANAVAEQYSFWLGDGFASGGSNGYDHKAMGITARGAWISVQRHFAERGVNVQTDPVTVLGIGDMSGDVFGNGMLLSESIRLVAAFNHLHIFIDPHPDAATGRAERQRLFALPRSGWGDYDQTCISAGGGIFTRQAKSILITPEMKKTFKITSDRLAPDELISALLRAPVQLIWNGGIGTYVKAAAESHAEVGDRANDHLRVDASELRCQVFGEGGNLGITQRARIEFSLAGGAVNTDFIDNSAGVDCSDHEVNIKIALNEIVAREDLTRKQRNELLVSMTDEVAELVLSNNHRQAQTLSLAVRHAQTRQTEYQRFITRMETSSNLDRALEFLPTDDELSERFGRGKGLTRPELAILLAYAKTFIKSQLVTSSIHEDPTIRREVLTAFPPLLRARFESALLEHRLAREIVSTQLANGLVDTMGITLVTHLMEFVGGTVEEIARAYFVTSESFNIARTYKDIEALEAVSAELKLDMLVENIRLGRRTARWLLRHRRDRGDVQSLIDGFRSRIDGLVQHRASIIGQAATKRWQAQVKALLDAGVPEPIAHRSANAAGLAVVLPIIDAADSAGLDPLKVASAYATLGHELGLGWLTEQLANLPPVSHWQAMERDSLLDDVTSQQCSLAALTLQQSGGDVAKWLAGNVTFAQGWRRVTEDAQHATVQDLSMYSMTCRKLADLCRGLKVAG